jgi:hypothetical protein
LSRAPLRRFPLRIGFEHVRVHHLDQREQRQRLPVLPSRAALLDAKEEARCGFPGVVHRASTEAKIDTSTIAMVTANMIGLFSGFITHLSSFIEEIPTNVGLTAGAPLSALPPHYAVSCGLSHVDRALLRIGHSQGLSRSPPPAKPRARALG